MPLSGGTMNPDIKTQVYNGLQAQFASEISSLSPAQQASIQAEWQKIATAVSQSGTAIVQHIDSDALVTGTVTSGAGAGGSVTGTVS